MNFAELYTDSRTQGYQGPTRNVRIPKATSNGGGAIAKSEDGVRCVVAGKESLRILRFSEPSQPSTFEHKSSVGRGGHRIDASRNFWDGSGLKIDSASTDVAWGHGNFNNKVLTSARNGELIMWDLNKSGPNKYERRSKVHIRSINKLSMSHIVQHYCITGSADGDLRVWDLRDMSKTLMRIHHPISVRSVVFSPSLWQPLQAVVGLDNGSIYRWDLKMGQRGQLDRLPVAHSGPVMALDWCNAPSVSTHGGNSVGGSSDASVGSGLGWIASGGLDRCVKVWNLTAPGSHAHISHKPTYNLHPSFPVRRVLWRPSYQCELAIVSNEELGTGSNHDHGQNMSGSGSPHPRGRSTAITERSGMITSEHPTSWRDKFKNSGGDAVEIWDTRRQWIAKWSVTGSAQGGVTDLAFADSHAMWTQHTSGIFSQIDLRDCTKPIDAIPRVAMAWEASGSVAFVSDRKSRWEIPYDDIKPGTRQHVDGQRVKPKVIGDSTSKPTSQYMGTYASNHSAEDLDVFSKLARGYMFVSNDRTAVCALNADTAVQAGNFEAAQAWSLLASLLTDLVPKIPPTPPHSPLPEKRSPFLYPVSVLPTSPSTYSFPPHNETPNVKSATSDLSLSKTRSSPHRTSPGHSDPPSNETSRKMTPTSSATSSPHYATSALPSTTSRQPSLLGRRDSDSGLTNLLRRHSIYRRPSISTNSASPSDRSASSLRHIGEGALDSSSSESNSENGEGNNVSSDEESRPQPPISPLLCPTRIIPAHPSPLSNVTGQQQWAQDKDHGSREDEVSPSPGSSDTESYSSSSPPPRPKSLRRNSGRMKSRSRGSTVVSLAALSSHRPLVKQASHSSIRTVIAAESSFREEDQSKCVGQAVTGGLSHAKQKSQGAVSEFLLIRSEEQIEKVPIEDASQLSDRRPDIVRADEDRYREIGFDILREQLEIFADEGDVQTCALLSLVAAPELRLGKRRMTKFLDSYIDLLSRLRLCTSAAYLRKNSPVENLRSATQLETTIYTSCGRCRKPCLYPAGAQKIGERLKGGYAYCRTCRAHAVKCSICHLPVRALLFQCAVCSHGGHQECYVHYYMERPMVNILSSTLPFPPVQGRTASMISSSVGRGSGGGSDDENVVGSDGVTESLSDSPVQTHLINNMWGHPCAAGCGHICWSANAPGQSFP